MVILRAGAVLVGTASVVGMSLWAYRVRQWRRFRRACEVAQQAMPFLSSQSQLLLYALYKHATAAPLPPSGSRKREAVNGVAHLSRLEAAQSYCAVLDELVEDWDSQRGGVLTLDEEDEDGEDELIDSDQTGSHSSRGLGMGVMSTMRKQWNGRGSRMNTYDDEINEYDEENDEDDDDEWEMEDFEGVPYIAQAAAENNPQRIRMLLHSKESSVHDVDHDGLTALHWASMYKTTSHMCCNCYESPGVVAMHSMKYLSLIYKVVCLPWHCR